jgi:hypothetical protein
MLLLEADTINVIDYFVEESRNKFLRKSMAKVVPVETPPKIHLNIFINEI